MLLVPGAGFQLIPSRKGWTGWKDSARFFWTFRPGKDQQQQQRGEVSPRRLLVGLWGRAFCNLGPAGWAVSLLDRKHVIDLKWGDLIFVLFAFLIWMETLPWLFLFYFIVSNNFSFLWSLFFFLAFVGSFETLSVLRLVIQFVAVQIPTEVWSILYVNVENEVSKSTCVGGTNTNWRRR